MVRQIDRRPAMTIKGDEITPEFRAVITKAAKRAGMTQSAWVVQRLGDLARRELAGEPDKAPVPAIVPPAVIEKLSDRLRAELSAELQARFTELRDEMAPPAKVRPGLVKRLFGG